MPNLKLNCKKPKSCDTCRFDIFKNTNTGWCVLLNEQVILPKIKKRKKNCPFNTKKPIFKKIFKEIKKCLKLKKKPKSLT